MHRLVPAMISQLPAWFWQSERDGMLVIGRTQMSTLLMLSKLFLVARLPRRGRG